jgi:PAS domain S-box-containing protein
MKVDGLAGMHSLLKRQLKRHFGEGFAVPPEWQGFIERVNDAYGAFDADRAMLEHSLELSSQELLDANAEMRAVFQVIPDLVLRLDAQGTVLDIKAGAASDLLVSREQLIGWRVQDVPLPGVGHQFEQAIAKLVAGNAAVTFEYAAVLHGQESHYEARLVPLPDRRIAAIVRNITERKQQLRLLGSALEQSTEVILITDAGIEGTGRRFLFVNPAFTRMSGYTADEVMGWDPPIMRTLGTDPSEWAHLPDTLRRGETYHGQHTCHRKDGTPFVLEAQIAPVRDSSGTITHFLGIHRDITERKRAEAALQKAHQELVEASRQAGMAEIATGVLHNVGNILNSVNVSAGLLGSMLRTSRARGLAKAGRLLEEHEADLSAFLTTDPKGRLLPGYLQHLGAALASEQARMADELAHLTQSIDHIKGVVATQQSHAKRVAVTEPVQICELAEDAVRLNAAALARKRVNVVREFAQVPVMRLDRARVLQILVNLISNASSAMENNAQGTGQITLTVDAPEGSRLRVAVRDQGEGIAPQNLTRIFAHGFTTRQSGHGFGLHSCALAAQQMGGTLVAHSDGTGCGATFTLELPIDNKAHMP